MHINDAAMDQTGAFEPPITFNPTVKTNMYVPKNSATSLEPREYISGGSSPVFSSGRQVWKRATASAAPMNSQIVYTISASEAWTQVKPAAGARLKTFQNIAPYTNP